MTETVEKDGQKATGTKGILLQVKGLTILTRAGVSLLSDISFHIEPGELIVLTGVSRSGKSTLLETLAGLQKPARGEVLIHGVDLYAHLKGFRSSIGFVPTELALPQNLTVVEVLQDGATLRLPRRTSSEDRRQRVHTLLETTGLTEVADRRISSLSAVEKQKLSIALELMSYPGLLLVDEPDEPLSPFEEIQITILLRQLCRQGLTIIQADQRARSAGLSDKVIFLAPGGLLAWFGPAEEGFAFLRTLVPRGIAKDLFALKEAIEILANPQPEQGMEWAKRFKAHGAYQKYVDDPLDNRYPDLLLQTRPLLRLRLRNNSQEKLPPAIIPRASLIQKFILMIRRNAQLLWRDKTLFGMIAIPPLIALVDFLISSKTVFDPSHAQTGLGLLVFLVLLAAGLLVQNEIFKERVAYQREERMTSLAFPYILSKVGLVGILAIYQGMVWTVIHFAATEMAGGLRALLLYGITFFLVAFIGGILGLMVSAFSRAAMTTTSWLLLLTVPQLIFSGATMPVANHGFPFNFLSGINPSRYALEALLATSGYGEGVNGSPLSYWYVLAVMSLGLIVLLLGIQQRAGRVRT